MNISELIKQLEEAKKEHGDIEVFSRSKENEFHGIYHTSVFKNAHVEEHGCGMNVVKGLYNSSGGTPVVIL